MRGRGARDLGTLAGAARGGDRGRVRRQGGAVAGDGSHAGLGQDAADQGQHGAGGQGQDRGRAAVAPPGHGPTPRSTPGSTGAVKCADTAGSRSRPPRSGIAAGARTTTVTVAPLGTTRTSAVGPATRRAAAGAPAGVSPRATRRAAAAAASVHRSCVVTANSAVIAASKVTTTVGRATASSAVTMPASAVDPA